MPVGAELYEVSDIPPIGAVEEPKIGRDTRAGQDDVRPRSLLERQPRARMAAQINACETRRGEVRLAARAAQAGQMSEGIGDEGAEPGWVPILAARRGRPESAVGEHAIFRHQHDRSLSGVC